jgi:hypothetical protein
MSPSCVSFLSQLSVTPIRKGTIDAGLFVFAYGVNPEAVLLLECDKSAWRYAVARLAWAELTVKLDGKEVARFEQLLANPESGPYRTAAHGVAETEFRLNAAPENATP